MEETSECDRRVKELEEEKRRHALEKAEAKNDMERLRMSLEEAREDVDERFVELQTTRVYQDTTATKRLEEVEELKIELLRMHEDRRSALADLIRDKEKTRTTLVKLQEASRSIEAEKESLVAHVRTTEEVIFFFLFN